VADCQDHDCKPLFLDTADDPVGADLVTAKAFQPAFQRFADALRVSHHPHRKETVDPVANDRIEREHLPRRNGVELNPEA
jgi:hypothetical protein